MKSFMLTLVKGHGFVGVAVLTQYLASTGYAGNLHNTQQESRDCLLRKEKCPNILSPMKREDGAPVSGSKQFSVVSTVVLH